MLGGHMRSLESPADPIFFMHHCQVDRIWAMWQDCHDHDVRTPTAIDLPRYGDRRGGSFQTGLHAELLYRHPTVGNDIPSIISTWDLTQTTPKSYHSSIGMKIPVVYAPDEMMKVMKKIQKLQICNYDTHVTFLIDIGQAHVLQPKHTNHQGLKNAILLLNKRLESTDTNTMTSNLLEATSHQCKEENAKAYGERMPKKPTLAVNFQKRWLNQGEEFDAISFCKFNQPSMLF